MDKKADFYNDILPDRLKEIKPFLAMEIMEKAQKLLAEGTDVVRMEVGEPAGHTPDCIKEALHEAVKNNDTGYSQGLGKLALREEIAAYYKKTYSVKISPEQIVVTAGSSPAMMMVMSVLAERGDQILLSDPYYACYPNFIRFVGADPLLVPAPEEEAFKLKASLIKKHLTKDVKAILINSPANPTGTVLDQNELKEIADLGPYIISDEIYHGINYTGKDHTMLEFTDKAVVVSGFSKRNIMTGWRLGYLIAPFPLIEIIQKIQQNLFICVAPFIQAGGIAALQESSEVLEKRFSSYNERRLYLYSALEEMEIAPKVLPEGAFYMMANVKNYTNDSLSFALDILDKARVAVTPGIDFGSGAEGYIRISYACSMEELKEGLSRLGKYLRTAKKNRN